MTLKIGDIVTLHGREGRWTVIAPYPSLDGRRYFHFREEFGLGHATQIVGAEDAAALFFRPVIPVGTVLQYRGERVTVVEDLEERVRCVGEEKRRAVGKYHITSGVGEGDYGRGELVSENIERLLRVEELENSE